MTDKSSDTAIAPSQDTLIMTFKVRVAPTRRQYAWLEECLSHTRALYNAALQEREDAYRRARQRYGKNIPKNVSLPSWASQNRALTELRRDPEFARFPRRLQCWALDRLEVAYAAMIKMRAAGEHCEISFRKRNNWHTIGLNSPIDCKMTRRGLVYRKFFGGTLRLMPHCELPPWEKCKALTLTRDGRRWYACLSYEVPAPAPARCPPKRPVGLDIGLKVAVARSDGALISIDGAGKELEAELRRAKRAVSRSNEARKHRSGADLQRLGRRRSNREKKRREKVRLIYAQIERKRKARLHEISAKIAHHFDAVAVENLNLQGLENMGGRDAQGRGLRKKWRDIAPGRFFSLLAWKAVRGNLRGKGRARLFVKVDPCGTSQTCPECGAIEKKTLQDRVHRCEVCGHVEDRDVAAARIVLIRAGWGPGALSAAMSAKNHLGGNGIGNGAAVRDALGNTAPSVPGHDEAALPLLTILQHEVQPKADRPVEKKRRRLARARADRPAASDALRASTGAAPCACGSSVTYSAGKAAKAGCPVRVRIVPC